MHLVLNDPCLMADELRGFCVGWKDPLDPQVLWNALTGSDRYVVARDDCGHIMGFANATSDGVFAAYIPLVEVLPEHQGMGVGTAIMQRLLDELRDIRIVDLMCDAPLQRFYERLGMRTMTGMRAETRPGHGAGWSGGKV